MNQKRLFRPYSDRVLAGVCGGLAQYFGLSSGLLRFITLLLILFGGLSVWVYIVLWIITPSGR
ncbi:MAG: PspC domain-containing protein [Rikenellaceae bacterium]